MADWIKLYLNVDANPEFRAFEESLRSGKRGRAARRTAEDVALAQVTRLYLLLGQTKYGRIDMLDTGERLLAEDVMREEGDALLMLFDRMAAVGVIDREMWTSANVVTTTNAVEQADGRRRSEERSRTANDAKRRKKSAKPSPETDGKTD